jgi:hypothetical protein
MNYRKMTWDELVKECHTLRDGLHACAKTAMRERIKNIEMQKRLKAQSKFRRYLHG